MVVLRADHYVAFSHIYVVKIENDLITPSKRHTGIPGLWTQELDAGLWTLNSGFWTLNSEPSF